VSGGDHRWFKRSTGKKRPVTGDIHIVQQQQQTDAVEWSMIKSLSSTTIGLPLLQFHYKNKIMGQERYNTQQITSLLLWH